MYQALYRKWRPRTFSDVIGQPHITETLARQVETGRVSHAYLFTGTRGTGKTTVAKILARAVNCEHPVNGNPCNECPACRGIENGSILDVLELDAASNNGVDDVRALQDEAIFSPATVKKRVYIIDEVHMLSTAAFNALLKTLEEPPEHLLFILATTEVHKVPATVLSRCQRFSFRRLRAEDIAARLRYVAEQEGIDLTEDGARLLSQLADGALRDGLSLLDQCRGGGGTVDADRVMESVGLAGSLDMLALLDAVIAGDGAAALERIDALYRAGKEMSAVLGELSMLLRDLLILQTAPKNGEALLSGRFDPERLRSVPLSATRLLAAQGILQEAQRNMAQSVNRRLDAEVALLRLCDPAVSDGADALAARVERLEALLADPDAAPRSRADPKPQPKQPTPEPEKPAPEEPKAPEPPQAKPAPAGDGEALRSSILQAAMGLNPSALAALRDPKQVQWRRSESGVLLLVTEEMTCRMLGRPAVRTALAAAERCLGAPVPVTIRERTAADDAAAAVPQADKFDGLLALGDKFGLSTK